MTERRTHFSSSQEADKPGDQVSSSKEHKKSELQRITDATEKKNQLLRKMNDAVPLLKSHTDTIENVVEKDFLGVPGYLDGNKETYVKYANIAKDALQRIKTNNGINELNKNIVQKSINMTRDAYLKMRDYLDNKKIIHDTIHEGNQVIEDFNAKHHELMGYTLNSADEMTLKGIHDAFSASKTLFGAIITKFHNAVDLFTESDRYKLKDEVSFQKEDMDLIKSWLNNKS